MLSGCGPKTKSPGSPLTSETARLIIGASPPGMGVPALMSRLCAFMGRKSTASLASRLPSRQLMRISSKSPYRFSCS